MPLTVLTSPSNFITLSKSDKSVPVMSEEVGAERGWARPDCDPALGVAGRGSLGLLPGRHLSYYGEGRERERYKKEREEGREGGRKGGRAYFRRGV